MTSSAGNSGSAEIIDLRSDFLSRATRPMLAAMAEAAPEACGFRPGEHPREQALQERAAEILGCEAVLFCVTCAQANQIAIHVHCRPGEAILAERTCHVITSEAGAAAVHSGVMVTGIAGRRDILDPPDVAAAIVQGDIQTPRTALVLMENTHVRYGGTVTPLETMQQIAAVARDSNIAVHLDGSRHNLGAAEMDRAADLVLSIATEGLGIKP